MQCADKQQVITLCSNSKVVTCRYSFRKRRTDPVKIVETIILHGRLNKKAKTAIAEVESAIIEAKITIPPIKKGNGVKPIKNDVMRKLAADGWNLEMGLDLDGMRAKPLDGYKDFGGLKVGFEWETGNISSSFRALMKLFKGLIEDQIDIGIHALPSREFYQYLTDRIGNIREMRPYIDVYKCIELPASKCCLILVVEQDKTDPKAKPIPKGSDGMAKQAKKKSEKWK